MADNARTPEGGMGRVVLVAGLLAVGFLGWGLLLYRMVGVGAPPAWDFGSVPDVPGLSPYSTAAKRPLSVNSAYYLHEQAVLSPQHVNERPVAPAADSGPDSKEAP